MVFIRSAYEEDITLIADCLLSLAGDEDEEEEGLVEIDSDIVNPLRNLIEALEKRVDPNIIEWLKVEFCDHTSPTE